MKTNSSLIIAASASLLSATSAPAEIPDAIPLQGRVSVAGENFTGTGQFRFAIYQAENSDFRPATAAATVNNGFITAISVIDGGAGYTNGVVVNILPGGLAQNIGSGATATATVTGGAITAINVTNAGSNYSSASFPFDNRPRIRFDEPSVTTLWNNTITTPSGDPGLPGNTVTLPVTNGLYVVGLGDTGLANMAALPTTLASTSGKSFVRIWFNDGTNGFQALSPDIELRSVPFAREAISARFASEAASAETVSGTGNPSGLGISGIGPVTDDNGMFIPNPDTSIFETDDRSRMFFSTGLSAFRAGYASGTQWDEGEIGLFSTAMGHNTTASGDYTAAFGAGSVASGDFSAAFGNGGTASGFGSFAAGDIATASAHWSYSIGWVTTASGTASTALGSFSTASGESSMVMGTNLVASGSGSLATGSNNVAASANETVIGSSATELAGDAENWVATDRLFALGNGTSFGSRSTAVTVLKNGRMGLLTADTSAEITHTLTLPNSGSLGVARAHTWSTYSDARVKSSVEPIEDGLERVLALRPVSYRHNAGSLAAGTFIADGDETETTIGFLAQEVAGVVPEAVEVPADPDNQLYGMKYEKLIPLLVSSVQELEAENRALRERIERLERE